MNRTPLRSVVLLSILLLVGFVGCRHPRLDEGGLFTETVDSLAFAGGAMTNFQIGAEAYRTLTSGYSAAADSGRI